MPEIPRCNTPLPITEAPLQQPEQPFAPAQSARYEHRSFSGGSNTVVSSAATGKFSPTLTVLGRYQQANSSNQKLTELGDTVNLKADLAYRDPNSNKFNALLRYQYHKNPATIIDTIFLRSGKKKGSSTKLVTSQATNWQKLQKRLSRRLFVQPTQEASSNAAVSPESTPPKAGETP